jgi:TonB family protein
VFAPNSTLRAQIVPGKPRKKRTTQTTTSNLPNRTSKPETAEPTQLTWAQRLKRAFEFDFCEDNSQLGKAPSIVPYKPIRKFAPSYPRRAQTRGIEGWVELEFAVNEKGETANIRVVESRPLEIFDLAATEATKKFIYSPQLENGKPVRVEGVRNTITFELGD